MTTTLTVKDYMNGNDPTWCPGCGDYSVLRCIQKSLVSLQVMPENAVLVSGIGCSGKIGHYFGGYSMHSTHGRALPVAQGIKAGRPELTVIAAGGDGDGYGIGVGHLVHAGRRNMNITYIVMDNGVYGNTKGQTSPTSKVGYQSSTTPSGNPDMPVNPLLLSWASGASFIAQGFSGDVKQMEQLITAAIRHNGFSIINVFSPCVVFNKTQGYDYYKKKIVIQEKPAANAQDFVRIVNEFEMPTGIIWKSYSDDSDSAVPESSVKPDQINEFLRKKIKDI
jgi:2-oxoglutarate ferredoxin oxidoreductase subunit beta